MNRLLRFVILCAGLAVIGWVGAGYGSGTHPNLLALGLTAVIGAVYIAGTLELRRFQGDTDRLAAAVASAGKAPPDLAGWLAQVPAALRHAVHRRVEGEPIGLPGPALAPYLAGFLVLLGMLGTFAGMVLTLRGAGLALEGATDLQAVRTALVAPVTGLGLAFGTSVAGVAASAMLGLLSALCRRERVQAVQGLDVCIHTTLRLFSGAHRREEALRLQQCQADLMPTLVDRLQGLMESLAQHSQGTHAQLRDSQEHFHTQAAAAYKNLAASVDLTLQNSLMQSARAAGETLQPVVEATMAGIARETARLQDALAVTAQRQLDALCTRVEADTERAAQSWQTALARHEHAGQAQSQALRDALDRAAGTFEHSGTALVEGLARRHGAWQDEMAASMASLMQTAAGAQERLAQATGAQLEGVSARLDATVRQVAQRWEEALAQHEQLSERVAGHTRQALADTVDGLQRQAASLLDTVTQAHAALREKLSESVVRDNALLDERRRMLETLGTLLDAVNQTAAEQRGTIDALVSSSAELLARVGQRFGEQVDARASALSQVAAQVTGGAAEVASLGEAFGFAVERFGQSSERLVAHMERIDQALTASLSRSDDQLAYYVAQAREVVDLSVLSQKQIIDDLQRLSRASAAGTA